MNADLGILIAISLSIEFRLPSSIPEELFCGMQDLEKAGFPANFASAFLIALESTKINKHIDLKMSPSRPTNADTTHHGLLKMLESDLTVLADSQGVNRIEPGTLACFSLLMAQLNIYSFRLSHATKVSTSDAARLRFTAFDYAMSLIQLFFATPFCFGNSK